MKNIELYCGDCLEVMKDIPDKSIDLVLIDPPYNIGKDKWDKWESVEDYVEFMGKVFLECQRVIKNNGSFYFFHNDFTQMAELQHWIKENTEFIFKSMITWNKIINADRIQFKYLLNGYGNSANYFNGGSEYILYYTFQDGSSGINNFKPLRQYSKELQDFIGLKIKDINKILGHRRAEHFFYHNSSQWGLCKPETYQELIDNFNIDKWKNFKKYDVLKQEYEILRYTFNKKYINMKGKSLEELKENLKYITTVWDYSRPKNEYKLHITPKPIELLKNIIEISSNENDIVLDCFMGSGSTGVACKHTNRKFIGIELDEKYFEIAKKRIEEE